MLVELSEEVRSELLAGMQPDELVAATEGLATDDLADLLAELPEAVDAPGPALDGPAGPRPASRACSSIRGHARAAS